MRYFQRVIEEYQHDNFNLLEYLQLLSPITSREHVTVDMKSFNLDSIRDCILHNISRQCIFIETSTTHQLIGFLDREFTNSTLKIYLQVLLHYSKMDVKLMHERYLCYVKHLPQEEQLTKEDFFNEGLSSFLTHASQQHGADETVYTLEEDTKEIIRNALLSTPILKAFSECLNKVLNSGNSKCIAIEDLRKEIQSMEMYSVKKFAPLDSLRGACLLDGILLCTTKLAGNTGTKINFSDLITLAMHECSHYLTRIYCGDFNFSSPSKLSEAPRVDPCSSEISLEMGRYMELIVFDGIQPHWFKSSELAATSFLNRLNTYSNIPLIKKSEHKMLGLKARLLPSPPFGIDIDEVCVFFE